MGSRSASSGTCPRPAEGERHAVRRRQLRATATRPARTRFAPAARLLPNGALCSDGFPCNGTETCLNQVHLPRRRGTARRAATANACATARRPARPRVCTQGPGLDCDDANPCTTDTCDPVTGCHHSSLPNSTSCSDGAVCNGAETLPGRHLHVGRAAGRRHALPRRQQLQRATRRARAASAPPGRVPAETAPRARRQCLATARCPVSQATVHGGSRRSTATTRTLHAIDSCNPVTACAHTPRPDGSSCDDEDVCNGVATPPERRLSGRGAALSATTPIRRPSTAAIRSGRPAAPSTTRSAGTPLNVRKSGLVRWGIKRHDVGRGIHSLGGAILGGGTSADPVLNGATLRVVSTTAASPFDGRYDLPAGNWSYVGAPGENAGWPAIWIAPRGADQHRRCEETTSPGRSRWRGADIGPHLDADPNFRGRPPHARQSAHCMSHGEAHHPLQALPCEERPGAGLLHALTIFAALVKKKSSKNSLRRVDPRREPCLHGLCSCSDRAVSPVPEPRSDRVAPVHVRWRCVFHDAFVEPGSSRRR